MHYSKKRNDMQIRLLSKIKIVFLVLVFLSIDTTVNCQPSTVNSIDPWKISATSINPSNYYGITVANGMIGIVSSPEPFKVKDVVLAGAYDLYGRGRVSNFLRSFNLLNMNMDIDQRRIGAKDISNMKQELDMHHASFTTSFDYADKASVTYTYYSLRQLPFTVLMDITITAK